MTDKSKYTLPPYSIFVAEGDGDQGSKLVKVGSVWNNKKGTGYNVVLDAQSEQTRFFILPSKR